MGEQDLFALAVVVVTHDSARWLPGFFRSWGEAVEGAAELKGKGVRVVVADSGSGDETLRVARELAPRAIVAECGNVGYGAAANRGVAAAARAGGTQWVLVCNADLTFGGDFLRKMMAGISAAEGQIAGCVAPLLLNRDGTVQPSVGRFPTVGGLVRDRFRRRQERKYVLPQPGQSGVVEWASGACLLFRREAFEALGGFDEKYFLYVEEVDLQRRMFERGFATVFRADVKVVHHAPNASREVRPEVQRWAARGMLRYFAKFGGAWALRGYGVLAVVSGRLPWREAFASRRRILERGTGR